MGSLSLEHGRAFAFVNIFQDTAPVYPGQTNKKGACLTQAPFDPERIRLLGTSLGSLFGNSFLGNGFGCFLGSLGLGGSGLSGFCFGLLGELGGTSSLSGGLSLALGLLGGLGGLDGSSALCLLSGLAGRNRLGCGAELVGEALDASTGVDQLLSAGEEGMARVADVDADLRLRGAGLEGVAAGAGDRAVNVLGTDFVLLGFSSLSLGFRPRRDKLC